MLCQHIICRKKSKRQDLQCIREANHEGVNHLHTVALGFDDYPNPPFSNLRGHSRPFEIRCSICNKPDWANYTEPTRKEMIEKNICFTCHFWLDQLSDRSNAVVIGGQHYRIDPSGFTNGFGGRRFKIRFFDGREIVTDNLWTQGKIPSQFQLPDTAEFVHDV